MNKIFAIFSIYLATVEAYRLDPQFDYHEDEYDDYGVIPFPRHALTPDSILRNFRNGGRVCGDLNCIEKVEVLNITDDDKNLIIPNVPNIITCELCVNRITGRSVLEPVTQQREVQVFEKTRDGCYHRRTTRSINDGCKCPQDPN